MKCVKCGKDKSLTELTMHHRGTIPRTHGMRRYEATCRDCLNAIDNTTMPDREPGCDDDLETPQTEW